jgi:hypothetical protein
MARMDGRLNRDHLDLLQAFVDADVRFLIVGAHAVGYHVEPRATGDLDVWIEPTSANARRTFAALRAFGAPLADLSEADLSTPGIVFQMGLPPNRIDVLNELSGDPVWERPPATCGRRSPSSCWKVARWAARVRRMTVALLNGRPRNEIVTSFPSALESSTASYRARVP